MPETKEDSASHVGSGVLKDTMFKESFNLVASYEKREKLCSLILKGARNSYYAGLQTYSNGDRNIHRYTEREKRGEKEKREKRERARKARERERGSRRAFQIRSIS